MKILEPGHIYELQNIDCEKISHKNGACSPNTLRFVNREQGTEHCGTQTQEVIRALIDRTQYCDKCLRWEGNDKIIYHLRMALVLHEQRALERKTEKGLIQPEHIVTASDGHFQLESR